MRSPNELSIGQCATLACLLEVSAPKPGNVHRGADFEDLSFNDFAASAVAIAPAMQDATERGVGATVHSAIEATRRVTRSNTNLGTVLLVAPLACVPRNESLAEGVGKVLHTLTSDDCQLVWQAIRLAQPGGMGKVENMDLAAPPPADLLAAMHAAADRDLVARQYFTNFELVLGEALPLLLQFVSQGFNLPAAIVRLQISLMSKYADSLIARKCGPEVAARGQMLAAKVLEAGEMGDEDFHRALGDFDFWLRSDEHKRNPGTTADLIAATLFAALRDGQLSPPLG